MVNYELYIFKMKQHTSCIKIRYKSTFLTVDFRFPRPLSPYNQESTETKEEQMKGLELLISKHVSDILNVTHVDKCPSLWSSCGAPSAPAVSFCVMDACAVYILDARGYERQSNAPKGAGEQTAVRLKRCVLRSLPVNGVNNKRRLVDLPMVLSDTAPAAWICEY